jgi:hypothetical protein
MRFGAGHARHAAVMAKSQPVMERAALNTGDMDNGKRESFGSVDLKWRETTWQSSARQVCHAALT